MQKTVHILVMAGVLALALVSTAHAQTNPNDLPEEFKINYSLFSENYKNNEFEASLPNLRWLLANHPTTYNSRSIHERAYNTYVELSKAAEDEAMKEAYRDTALQIFESYVTSHKEQDPEFTESDEVTWYLRVGNYIAENADFFEDPRSEMTTNFYRRAFDLNPEEVDGYYARLIPLGYARQGDKDAAVEFMDIAEPYYEGDEETTGYFDTIRDNLFKTPQERIGFLESRLEKTPDDVSVMEELFELYKEVADQEGMERIGESLSSAEPSARVYRLLADARYNNGDPEGALDQYEAALELAEDEEVERDIYYNMSIAQLDLNQLQAARASAERALRLDSDFGAAHVQLGDIYVRAVQGSEYSREDKAVFWLAVDHYERAARVDPSVSATARQKSQTYREFFPDQEEKFFENWKAGDSYNVNQGRYSWINRSTTIR